MASSPLSSVLNHPHSSAFLRLHLPSTATFTLRHHLSSNPSPSSPPPHLIKTYIHSKIKKTFSLNFTHSFSSSVSIKKKNNLRTLFDFMPKVVSTEAEMLQTQSQ
ncbi:hypothetical protein LIER_27456 [Lithospermum erythrorhizon]|uniref:Uncharacterized protein n=1 Tax=Lithospermum erythrorhizon TaxID=34254 RepID=A0AAV3RC41_LITER